ncbi:CHAT domain-containing protein [Streptomyces olindensis]|uniref:CHAT domain-containing protein n=1 Tax=Streptomyces olindensis TaxID=358823 RepID=UPI0033E7051C
MTEPPETLPPPPSPGAIELATVLSIATRMEPELIRAVRLRLLPHLDVGAEADLWFCDWVGARTPEAIALIPECLPYLRAGLVDKLETEPRLREVMGIVTEFHRGLSPALLLEEQITWDSLSGDTDGATRHLDRALHALVRENRSGLAGWFAEASRRLPSETLSTATAWSLAHAARPHVPALDPGTAPELTLATVSSIASVLGEAPLGVLRDGEALLLGKVRGQDAAAVLVPDTSPRVVEVTAGDAVRTVRVDAAEVVRVPVGTGPVTLRTGAGHVYVIDGPVPVAPRPDTSPFAELGDLIGPEVDPELVPRLIQAIRHLLDESRRTDDTAALRRALTLSQRALDAGYEPRDFPELGCEAAEALYLHGVRLGSRKSLEQAVRVAQRVTGVPAPELSVRAGALLGAAQREIFCHTGDLSQLHRSVDTLETWTDRLLGGPVPVGRLVSELFDTYLMLHEIQSGRDALLQALDLGRAALESPADREAVALSFTRILVARYEMDGDPRALDEAEHLAEVVPPRQESRSVQAERAAVLGSVHMARFWRDGSQEALQAALRQYQSAVRICPGSDRLSRARLRRALSEVLRVRAAVLSEHKDLDEAVRLAEWAAKTLPGRSVWRMAALNGLNRCLLDRFRRTGSVSDLDLAVNASREVVSHSRNHPDLPYEHTALVQQGECLILRYKATGNSSSLSQAVERLRATREFNRAQGDDRSTAYACALLELYTLDSSLAEVASALTELHSLMIHDDLDPRFTGPEWAPIVLAQAAFVSFLPKQSSASLRRAAEKAHHVARDTDVPPLLRLRAGLVWGNLAIRQNRSEDVLLSYETVAALVPLVLLTSGPEHADLLRSWEKLSREAAAHAIELGAPEYALEFLEQRSVLQAAWRQGSYAEVNRLREAAPNLVAELRQLWAFLHLVPASLASRARRPQGPVVARLEQLVAAVRALPDFEHFLAPVPTGQLVAAASEGPVVVLNAAAHRCDALLVTRQGVSVLPLPEVNLVELSNNSAMYRLAAGHDRPPTAAHDAWYVLDWLRETVVGPVLSALGMTVPPGPGPGLPDYAAADARGSLPRVWWCPTDPFAVLPLHLAGQRRNNVLHYAVHSYTSSLQALTAARHRERYAARASLRDPVQPMLLVLADDDLPHGQREIEAIGVRVPHVRVLRGERATGADVAARLGEHPCFHFIGRAGLHNGVPHLRFGAEGALDRPRLGLRPDGDGSLAYLSVRETEGSDLILENDGWALATCFQAAGYDHVIGLPVWFTDRDAADLAEAVYERLQAPDGRLHPERSAHALHDVLRLALAESPDRALAFAAVVHLGP